MTFLVVLFVYLIGYLFTRQSLSSSRPFLTPGAGKIRDLGNEVAILPPEC